tara:strand:+ start:4537 stop:4887 length:351 start_codon:yes stop_codon:yes gene_type:complete
MAIHSLTVKQIISRVRQAFPNAPEAYIMSLINDALNELGQYSQKSMSAKINIVADQMFYDISDNAKDSSDNAMGINKIHRVDIMDDNDEYIQVPRVLDGEPLMFDISSESAIKEPT